VVAKKKNAAEGEIPKPKTGAWGKSPAAGEQMEFDPSRVAGILSGKSGEQLDSGSAADAPVAETHAVEGWEQPFRDGYSEDRPSEADAASTAAPAPVKGKKPAKDKNRAPVEGAPPPKNSNAELIEIVEKIERLMEEAAGVRDDIKEVYGFAKGTGFDTGTIRKAIARRAKDPEKLAEQEALLDTYLHALGMI
jgi:uncharacterized protein (UPF0335 family)